jgi:Glyoxalase-like domain
MTTMKVALRMTAQIGMAVCLFTPAIAAETRAQIDHVILGIDDLEHGIAAFERLTGVRPAYGGKHPGGTHNALVSLGGGTYLEIIAVQPGAAAPPQFAELAKLQSLTPVGWAVSTDLAHLRAELDPAHLQLTEPRAGSRVTPAGATLSWQTASLREGFDEAPFFIAWAPESPHPSSTSPKGCTLLGLRVGGPNHKVLGALRDALHLGVEVADAPAPSLRLSLSCPRGTVNFDSGSTQK